MRKALRVVEIAWLAVAAISIFEIIDLWNFDDQKFWMFVGALVVAVFMFFFRRKQRLKFEARQDEKLRNSQ